MYYLFRFEIKNSFTKKIDKTIFLLLMYNILDL